MMRAEPAKYLDAKARRRDFAQHIPTGTCNDMLSCFFARISAFPIIINLGVADRQFVLALVSQKIRSVVWRPVFCCLHGETKGD